MARSIITLVFLSVFAISCNQIDNPQLESESKFLNLTGPYLGQNPPGMTPEIFAPGIISNGDSEVCISFTLDAKEMFFSVAGNPNSVVFTMKEINGIWTAPEVAPFSGKYSSEFLIAPDGKKIVLGGGAPLDRQGPPKSKWGVWVADKENSTWGEAEPILGVLNSEEYTLVNPSMALSENIYFCSNNFPGVMGGTDILMTKKKNGIYESIEVLDGNVNTEYWELDPYVAPDESHLIFASSRPGGSGGQDLYISFRNEDGSWTAAKNMGENVNSRFNEVHPSVTLDGKYLFFCSNRYTSTKHSEHQLSYEEKLKILDGPNNGYDDIYWVDVKVIEDLRPKN